MSPKFAKQVKTILLVDDDSNVVRLVREILSIQGYNVLEAETTEGAIESAQRHLDGIDLLIIDAVMPKISGPELADILLFLRPEMKVLFITGLDSLAIQLAFHQPCECLQKPFTPRLLLSKVQELLGETALPAAEQMPTSVDS
jgi:DNA-binding NtrC family response regulator